MARFPGTETHSNRAGLRPGDGVRCRRSRANAEAGLADRRGIVCEVRLGNARVAFGTDGAGGWLPNEALLPEPDPADASLALLGRVLRTLHAERVEFEDGSVTVFSGEIPAAALDEVRQLLGGRLVACTLAPAGVHEIATHLRWHP
ncbi:MAG: hypothetical protein ACYTG2_09285 [Planctomycetota bacterium]|jgi:hypothetical protein